MAIPKVSALIFEVGKEPEVREVSDCWTETCRIVEGEAKVMKIRDDLLVCAAIDQLSKNYNMSFGHHRINGTFIVLNEEEDEHGPFNANIDDEQIVWCKQHFHRERT